MIDDMNDPNWWRQAVVYQVYPRSFADANGDSIGDLAGVLSRIGYLKNLGVDAVWLSPFYPSALVDGGYDIDNYRAVDPTLGTLEDFDALVAALHRVGIKVVIDIVPNHTSDRHEWFQAALKAAPGSPERDRYLFRDGLGPDGSKPPADWESEFGGPAWTQVPDGQWYLHTHAAEQPDLNWKNREVQEDFLKTLKFWADRGVDGFRVDVAQQLAKDLPEVLPSNAEIRAKDIYPDGQHPTRDRDDLFQIYREWRTLFNQYDPPRMAVAEAWVSPHRRVLYASPETLGQAFNFDLLRASWDAEEFRNIITRNLELAAESGATSTWVFSNHDAVRHATRFGLGGPFKTGAAWLLSGGTDPVEDIGVGLDRARAATLLELALPGSAYLYQGEELGLREVADIPADRRQDPAFFRKAGKDVGRDGCRVPLPWTLDAPSFGFGEAEPHLPQPSWFADYAVAAQEADEDSTLMLYRRAIALRKELQRGEQLEWISAPGDAIAFRRGDDWACLTNFAGVPVPGPPADRIVLSSNSREPYDGAVGGTVGGTVPANSTIWYRP